MTLIQALILSVLQGASELFPVSSLGHAIVVPTLLGWSNSSEILDPTGPFLPFLVTLHLGTATALLIFYWAEWKRIVAAFFGQFAKKEGSVSDDAKIANLLVAGTIPGALLGLLLEKHLRHLFASPKFAAVFLIVNGFLMIGGEILRRSSAKKETSEATDRTALPKLSTGAAIGIGLSQALALIPGISRSGATITGGLLAKLNHEDAAKFAFLLATPIIFAAGIVEVPKFKHITGQMEHIKEYSAIGFFVSGIVAYLSVKFLTKYFETKRLDPFGYYCIILGAATLAVLKMHA